MMIGGEPEPVGRLDPIFATLAPGIGTIERTPGRARKGGPAERGDVHRGPKGAGHVGKRGRRGSERRAMQPYAEGIDSKQSGAMRDAPGERPTSRDHATDRER